MIFEAEPIPWSFREAVFGGVDRYARLDGYKNSQIIIETTKQLDRITSQVVVQSKSFDEVFKHGTQQIVYAGLYPGYSANRKRKRTYCVRLWHALSPQSLNIEECIGESTSQHIQEPQYMQPVTEL